jgi:hypothetical protein
VTHLVHLNRFLREEVPVGHDNRHVTKLKSLMRSGSQEWKEEEVSSSTIEERERERREWSSSREESLFCLVAFEHF